MNKYKQNAFLIILCISIAGYLNVNSILKYQIPFYNAATIQSIKIDSVSLISSDPAYGVHTIIGYGYLDSSDNYLAVDMTEGLNINSFSMGEAYAFEGQKYEVYVNSNFERGRLKTREIPEMIAKSKRNLLIYSICFLPLIGLICFWIYKLK